jgi:hypothetical protein
LSARVSAGAVLFFVLLAATVTVAVLVVRARTPDLVLEVLPGSLPCSIDRDRLESASGPEMTFFVRESDDDATVGIVDASEELVRTLDSGAALEVDEEVTYEWDGRDDAGEPVPPGRYRLYVALPGEDREMVWPRRISVEVPTTARACGS